MRPSTAPRPTGGTGTPEPHRRSAPVRAKMISRMAPTEYACVFSRPPRERLVAAERLARALPAFVNGAAGECDLFHSSSTRYLALLLRAGGGFAPEVVARLAFWTARTGGGGLPVTDLSDAA